MKKLSFQYETHLSFSKKITRHFFVLRFMPLNTSAQKICSAEYFVKPQEHIDVNTDCFGNTTVIGRMVAPHEDFHFSISGIAFTDVNAVGAESLHPVYKYASPYTQATDAIIGYYKEKLSEKLDAKMTNVEKAAVIMETVYKDFSYCPGVTTVKTTASEALAIGQGVCQDYAHICIALLRYAKVPARYVAGLLLGEGATHAWAEVYEQDRWVGIDPTHNRMVDDDYIKISQGRDYGDCMVERGTFVGIAEQLQEVHARVEAL